MKRLLFLCILISSITITGKAQMPDRIGVKTSVIGHEFINQCGELNGIWCHFQSYSTYDFGLALVGKWNLSSRVEFLAEPGISNRRWSEELDYAAVEFNIDPETGERVTIQDTTTYYGKTSGADLVYITLPVEGQWDIAPDWLITPYLEAGPRMDILVHRKVFDPTPRRLKEMINHYNRITAGINTGFGLAVEDIKGFGDINAGVNLDWDLLNSYSDRLAGMHNRAIEFYLRVML